MRTRRKVKFVFDYDEEMQKKYLFFVLVSLVIIFILFIAWDPVWRAFIQGTRFENLGGARPDTLELNESLIRRLQRIEPWQGPHLADLEDALARELKSRRAIEAPGADTLAHREGSLDSLARSRSASLERAGDTGRAGGIGRDQIASLLLAIHNPQLVLKGVERSRVLGDTASYVARELVDGWMNDRTFMGVMRSPLELSFGVGAIQKNEQVVVDVLLLERYLTFDSPPEFVRRDSVALHLTGNKLTDGEMLILQKGPKDQVLTPEDVTWSGNRFSMELKLSQGDGIYTLRASAGDRYSDLRPFFLKQ